jgi:methyl-accepting chemotaxis protein/methyl-accepting chemotaxis protein-1 (serine sensor receptor)
MGFAVVADEVRNLAQRSAQAAKDTAVLIEESIGHSKEGITRLDQVAQAIRSITTSAAQVKTLIDEVSLGSQEQSRGIEQIAKAVAQMQQVTQKTAANAEESASASEEMSAQATSMNDLSGELQAVVGGGDPARVKPRMEHRGRLPARPAGATPPRSEGAASLTALRSALAQPSGGKRAPAKVEAFPLEGDFREF